MKKSLTLLAVTIAFTMNAQMVDNSHSTNNTAGNYSVAMGYNTTAGVDPTPNPPYPDDVYYATAMGFETIASGLQSTAMGSNTTASGSMSIAMGDHTIASHTATTAMGSYTTASGNLSTAMGYHTIASGSRSTAMGDHTTASDYTSLVIGQYNSSGSSAISATSFSTSGTAFVIGNGTNEAASDAFKVMFNGDTTVSNDLTISGDLVVSSDARLKSNIVSLGSTLSRLLLIDGKSYTMLKDGKQKIGVLAQDIQKVFPELVTTDDKEMLAVNYQGLVPVLINALKEQQSEIDTYRNEVSELKEMVNQLISSKK